MKERISVYILSSLMALCSLTLHAQEGVVREAVSKAVKERTQPATFQGMSLLVEVGAPIYKLFGGEALGLDAGLRFNFKNHYFAIGELGYTKYDGTNDNTNIRYKTSAPYLRIGGDVNMLKDKTQNNRLLVGARIGYSPYKFDVDGPDITDPIWGNSGPLHYEGLSNHRIWFEFVVGLEAEISRNLHLALGVRYKAKLQESTMDEATPYYVPGYGAMGDNGFSITYHVIFDLSKKIKTNITK